MSHFYFLVDVQMQLYGLLGATLKICSMHAENYILVNQGEKCCIKRVTDSDTDCKKCQPKSKKKKKLDSLYKHICCAYWLYMNIFSGCQDL